MANPMAADFGDKPRTASFAKAISDYVESLGDVTSGTKAQLSYEVKRKFLWLWVYEGTADGTLYLSVTLDREVKDEHIHEVTQTSTNRWNHHVVVRTAQTARSAWLHDLIRAGYEFAGR